MVMDARFRECRAIIQISGTQLTKIRLLPHHPQREQASFTPSGCHRCCIGGLGQGQCVVTETQGSPPIYLVPLTQGSVLHTPHPWTMADRLERVLQDTLEEGKPFRGKWNFKDTLKSVDCTNADTVAYWPGSEGDIGSDFRCILHEVGSTLSHRIVCGTRFSHREKCNLLCHFTSHLYQG